MPVVSSVENFPSYDEFEQIQKKIAEFIILGGHEITDEFLIRDFMLSEAMTEREIEYTCDWIENVVRSGKAIETLDMIYQKSVKSVRVENPFDQPYLSDEMWKKIESWRLRGIIPNDVVERLLVGLRNMDVRDWEEDEVKELVANLIAPAFSTEEEFADFAVYDAKITEQFYC